MSKELLTKDEVEAVIEFSQGLYTYGQYGTWSPFMSNQLLQNLNGTTKVPNSENVRKALMNYKENEDNIQSYMDFARVFDMLFSRVLKSYANALSFDLQIVCTNAYTNEDYTSDAYLKDKKRIYDFLNKFDYKNEFRKVTEQILTHETYYTWFRKTKWNNKGMKYALQILPQDRCMLTGYWEKGLLFDFDMTYFLQTGVDIDGYDPAFKKYFKKVFVDSEMFDNYKPTNKLNSRFGTYAMWTQTSPQDGAWCFKGNMDNFSAIPFLAPFLKNAISNDEIEQLQYNKDMAEAYAILAGEIATFDTAKSGTKADQMVFNPKTLGSFMGKAKQGLSSTIKLAALPLENLKWYQFEDSNKEMYSEQLVTSAGVGTGASRLIYANDRMSNAEIEGALNEVYQTMKPLYYQFGNFLDFFANQVTKKYKFKFVFDGSNYLFERKDRFDNLNKLAEKGIVLSPSVWASAIGMQPQVFEASLAESKYSNWIEDFSQIMKNINTTSQNETGRPKSDNPDDSTERNWNQ